MLDGVHEKDERALEKLAAPATGLVPVVIPMEILIRVMNAQQRIIIACAMMHPLFWPRK
jgi:hypothetical protein